MTGSADGRSRTGRLRVLVVGQASTTPGGMSSVQRLHERFLTAREDVELHVATTYDETGLLHRLRLMVGGLARALAMVLTRRVDVVHLHVAKGLSALRKGIVVVAARRAGVPTVLHTHAGAFADWFDGLPAPVRPVAAWLLRADRVVAHPRRARSTPRGSGCPTTASSFSPSPSSGRKPSPSATRARRRSAPSSSAGSSTVRASSTWSPPSPRCTARTATACT